MRNHRRELNLRDALSDPLVQVVMAADNVDPRELQAMLSGIVSTLNRRAQPQQERCSPCLA